MTGRASWGARGGPDHALRPDPAAFALLFVAAFWLVIAGLVAMWWGRAVTGGIMLGAAAAAGLALRGLRR